MRSSMRSDARRDLVYAGVYKGRVPSVDVARVTMPAEAAEAKRRDRQAHNQVPRRSSMPGYHGGEAGGIGNVSLLAGKLSAFPPQETSRWLAMTRGESAPR